MIFIGNANRVGYDATITYQKPDQRQRLRELGAMGDLSDPSNVYNIETDTVNSKKIVRLRSDRLAVKYDNATFFFTQLKDSTECSFSTFNGDGIYSGEIKFDITQSTELIKNSRVSYSENLILRFDSNQNYQNGYDNINTAVSETANGDHIRVVGGTLIKNTNNDAKVTGEININSKELTFDALYDEMYTVDMVDLSSRAFGIYSSASVTIRDAIIKNGSLSAAQGAGIRSHNSTLSLEDSIVTSNSITYSYPIYGGGHSFTKQ